MTVRRWCLVTLALKANTTSLSTVATSGDYNDLANKPTIGGSYTLPTASASTLGGIKIGANLSIDANGVLSAAASGNSASTLSGVVLHPQHIHKSDIKKPITTKTQKLIIM